MRARFPGRVIRPTGHASSIRTSFDRARDVPDGPPGSCCRSHEWPILPVPRCTLRPEQETPTLGRESALGACVGSLQTESPLPCPRAPPSGGAYQRPSPSSRERRGCVLTPGAARYKGMRLRIPGQGRQADIHAGIRKTESMRVTSSRGPQVDDLPGKRFRFLQSYLPGTGIDRDDRERGYAVCALGVPGERTAN